MEISDFDSRCFSSAYIPHEIFYVTPTPLHAAELFCRVNRAGFTSETPSNFFIRRTDMYGMNVIHCVTKGAGEVTVRGKTHKLEAGKLFILPANEAHSYQSNPKDPMGLLWIEYTGGNSKSISQSIADHCGPIIGGTVFHEIAYQCALLLSNPHPPLYEETQILYSILVTLGFQHLEAPTRQSVKDQAILDYIDANLSAKLTLAQVGAVFGYHPNYLSSLFTKIAGMSFAQYVMHRRLSQACYLLVTTEKSLEQISSELGFYDVSHFILRFKSVEGVTPSYYRKESGGLVHAFQTE